MKMGEVPVEAPSSKRSACTTHFIPEVWNALPSKRRSSKVWPRLLTSAAFEVFDVAAMSFPFADAVSKSLVLFFH